MVVPFLRRLWQLWEREPLPCYLCLVALLTGAFMFLPVNQTYRFLLYEACRHPLPSTTLPLYVWGGAFVAGGACHGAGLLSNKKHFILVAGLIGVFLWLFVGVAVWSGAKHVGTGYTCFLIALVYADVVRRLYHVEPAPILQLVNSDRTETADSAA